MSARASTPSEPRRPLSRQTRSGERGAGSHSSERASSLSARSSKGGGAHVTRAGGGGFLDSNRQHASELTRSSLSPPRTRSPTTPTRGAVAEYAERGVECRGSSDGAFA